MPVTAEMRLCPGLRRHGRQPVSGCSTPREISPFSVFKSPLGHVRVDVDLPSVDGPSGDPIGEPGGTQDGQQALDDAQPFGPGGDGGQ
jgi:hypothetical protein